MTDKLTIEEVEQVISGTLTIEVSKRLLAKQLLACMQENARLRSMDWLDRPEIRNAAIDDVIADGCHLSRMNIARIQRVMFATIRRLAKEG